MLNTIPSEEELNYQFSKRFLRKMNKLIKYERKSTIHKSIAYYGKKVAVVFLIIFSIAFTSTMSIKAYRTRFFEMVTEIWEEFTSFIFKSDEKSDDDIIMPIIPRYIPDGYFIVEEKDLHDVQRIMYKNKGSNYIFYEQSLLSYATIITDTEGVDIEDIIIGSVKVTSFTNKGTNRLHWNDGYYYYSLVSSVDMDELIKMAESIINN